jgi:hypothetical protein
MLTRHVLNRALIVGGDLLPDAKASWKAAGPLLDSDGTAFPATKHYGDEQRRQFVGSLIKCD